MLATTLLSLTSAQPPADPEHGINETIYHALWSGDRDAFVNESDYYNRTGETRTPLEELANASDIPFDRPPEAVEQWNRGEFRTIPETNRSVSIGPQRANRTDAAFIRDAFVSIFAIQPSTKARLTPEKQPLYVGENGTVLALTDYTVVHPKAYTFDNVSYRYDFASDDVRHVRLFVDGERENSTDGGQTTTIGFDNLSAYPGRTHVLTVEAEIVVTIDQHSSECTAFDSNDTCERWENESRVLRSRHTVSTSRNVTEYQLHVFGTDTRLPNGDRGLRLYESAPWSGFETAAGTVRGSWRFYTIRDRGWDSLIVKAGRRSTAIRSPALPLQVDAYPIEGGPVARSQSMQLLDSYGLRMDAPQLQRNVHLDVPATDYTASYGLVVRIDRDAARGPLTGEVQGLVRGATVSLESAYVFPSPTVETTLDLTVESVHDGVATVGIRLCETASGKPIDTSNRPGFVRVNGVDVDTGPDGRATQSVPLGNGIVSAQYLPAPWWRYSPGHLGDSDAVFASKNAIDVVTAVFQIGVPVGLVLLAAFIVDRITGIPIWPPWRL